MKNRNVLVFPAGTEIGLEIFHSLKYCKEVTVFGAGDSTSNHAKFVYPDYHFIPNISEEKWVSELATLCETLAIDYIFPAYDDVIVSLANRQDEIPATVISSSYRTCVITRSKSSTYQHMENLIKVPVVHRFPVHDWQFPLLVKPDKGQGSFGVRKVNNQAELLAAISEIPDALICEYLPGEEYTVDCFSDREDGLLFAKSRVRHRTRNGISVNTVTEELDGVWDMAAKIGRALEMRGAWFFQLKRDRQGILTLLEIAPRVAGSMAAHRVMGVNFPLLSIFEHERLPVKVLINPGRVELDRALCNRFHHEISYDSIYVDLDDTLVFRAQVNLSVIKFIFQCINRGKQVKLITRHNGHVGRTLEKYRLSGLFDEVIYVGPGTPKSAYIKGSDALLLDDSFSERLEVATTLGIPTFDCSMIEMLIEESPNQNDRDVLIEDQRAGTSSPSAVTSLS